MENEEEEEGEEEEERKENEVEKGEASKRGRRRRGCMSNSKVNDPVIQSSVLVDSSLGTLLQVHRQNSR